MNNTFDDALAQAAKNSPEFAAVLTPIEADTQGLLVKAATQTDNPYSRSSNQVEFHLKRAQEMLLKCVDLRRHAYDLESEAVKLVWNSVVVDSKTEADKEFDEEYYTHRQYTVSEQYAPGENPMPPRTPESSFQKVREALQSKRDIAIAYEDALARRQNIPGSSFNFVERNAAIRKLYTFLLVDSYFRCRAAAEGLKSIYQISSDLPPVGDSNAGYTDALLEWVNNQLQTLESLVCGEVETDVTAWIRAAKLGLSWSAAPTPALTSTSGVVTVPNSLFDGLKFVRLRNVAFAIQTGPEATRPTSFLLSVRPPGLNSPIQIQAPVVSTKYTMSSPEFTANSLFNVSPIGEWSINFLNGGNSNAGDKATAVITDIAINLHIAGVPN